MRNSRAFRRISPVVALLAATAALGACGDDTDGDAAPTPQVAAPSTVDAKDLPRALAENRAQANELIDGAAEALEAKLDDLRGHPVVVNQWGSWCPPCRAEFPFFADLAEEHAGDVAFLGIDIRDERAPAEEFLREFPVPYPSIFDPDAEAVESLDWAGFSPTTWFIDERGEITFVRNGAYPDAGTLNADIHNYLLRG